MVLQQLVEGRLRGEVLPVGGVPAADLEERVVGVAPRGQERGQPAEDVHPLLGAREDPEPEEPVPAVLDEPHPDLVEALLHGGDVGAEGAILRVLGEELPGTVEAPRPERAFGGEVLGLGREGGAGAVLVDVLEEVPRVVPLLLPHEGLRLGVLPFRDEVELAGGRGVRGGREPVRAGVRGGAAGGGEERPAGEEEGGGEGARAHGEGNPTCPACRAIAGTARRAGVSSLESLPPKPAPCGSDGRRPEPKGV